jgi:hypothetical protein
MQKFLFRIVSLLLAPCLIADPSLATALVGDPALVQSSGDFSPFKQSNPAHTRLSPFASEALATPLSSNASVPRSVSPDGRVRHSFWRLFHQQPIPSAAQTHSIGKSLKFLGISLVSFSLLLFTCIYSLHRFSQDESFKNWPFNPNSSFFPDVDDIAHIRPVGVVLTGAPATENSPGKHEFLSGIRRHQVDPDNFIEHVMELQLENPITPAKANALVQLVNDNRPFPEGYRSEDYKLQLTRLNHFVNVISKFDNENGIRIITSLVPYLDIDRFPDLPSKWAAADLRLMLLEFQARFVRSRYDPVTGTDVHLPVLEKNRIDLIAKGLWEVLLQKGYVQNGQVTRLFHNAFYLYGENGKLELNDRCSVPRI